MTHFDCECCSMPDAAEIIADGGVIVGSLCPWCAYQVGRTQIKNSGFLMFAVALLFGVFVGAATVYVLRG